MEWDRILFSALMAFGTCIFAVLVINLLVAFIVAVIKYPPVAIVLIPFSIVWYLIYKHS